MTLTKFNALPIDEQAEYLWNYRPLDGRTDNQHTILLYSLPEFYAEVFYHREDNRIVQLKAFTGIRHLAAYLKQQAQNPTREKH